MKCFAFLHQHICSRFAGDEAVVPACATWAAVVVAYSSQSSLCTGSRCLWTDWQAGCTPGRIVNSTLHRLDSMWYFKLVQVKGCAGEGGVKRWCPAARFVPFSLVLQKDITRKAPLPAAGSLRQCVCKNCSQHVSCVGCTGLCLNVFMFHLCQWSCPIDL